MSKAMKKGDNHVKGQICDVFKHCFLMSGFDFQEEIKNQDLALVMREVLSYFNSSKKGFVNDVNANSLQRGLK